MGHWPTVYALVWALQGHSRPLGRRALVQKTGITEMTVRTHLNKLRSAGYVKMAKAGTSLTAPGLEAFAPLWEKIRWAGPLALRELALDRHGAAALLRGVSRRLRESWRYRDTAVREGATGALLLVKDDAGWAFSDEPLLLSERYPQDAALLETTLPSCQAGDALIVAFGPEPRDAQLGLWRVVVELLPPSDLTFPVPTESGG